MLRLSLLCSIVVAVANVGAAHAGGGGGAQPLVRLKESVVVRARPASSAPAIQVVSMRRPISGSRTVLPVLQEATGPAGVRWLRVALPVRPNGTTGWIRAAEGTPAQTDWQIVVHRAAHRAVVLEDGQARRTFSVVVGKPSTPTPLGRFFVTEKLWLGDGVSEGPWALATSAYSDVLQSFAGGPGEIGLHGDVGFSAPLGSSASHGCIRFADAAISWIAARVGPGTPVLVER
jgi:lipoprotein-anchoring transpeptidase ErfK/SrfK